MAAVRPTSASAHATTPFGQAPAPAAHPHFLQSFDRQTHVLGEERRRLLLRLKGKEAPAAARRHESQGRLAGLLMGRMQA